MDTRGGRVQEHGRKRVRLSRAQRREQLLDTACELIAAEGLQSFTMDRVGSAAGVSKGLSYAYFGDLEELLDAVLARELKRLKAVRRQLPVGEDPTTRVRAHVRSRIQHATSGGNVLRTLLLADSPPAVRRRARGYRAEVRRAISEVGTAKFSLARKEAGAAAGMMTIGIEWVAERAAAGDDPDMLEDTFITMMLVTLQALGESPRKR